MSETMEVEDSEEASNIDNSPVLVPNANTVNDDVIDVESDASSDITYVDEHDTEIANPQNRTAEIHDSISIQPDTANPISNELSQKSSSINSADSSSSSSPSKKRRHSELPIEEDDSQLCPICLDNFTTSGDHRLCSLKCGHLFGNSCIRRWMDSNARKSCPTCKKKTNKHEIRYIFARRVIAMDTTELTIIKQKLENVIEEKNRIQVELSKAMCRVHTLTDEVSDYKRKLAEIMYAKQMQREYRLMDSQSSMEIVHLYKEKTIDLGKNSSCRVFDCKSHLELAAITMKSTNNLYSGYGIKTINLCNFKPTAFIALHSQAIRDVKFHEEEPWLLSCSVDKKIKVLDINTNSVITTFDSNNSLWSCCWDIANNRMLYVGRQQGSVQKFDMRQPSRPLTEMSIEGDYSPVVSIQAVKPSSSDVPFEAVVACKLNSAWIFDTPLMNETQEYMQSALPFDGPFVSMTYNKENDHLLLSSRPNAKCPYSRHFLSVLNKRGDSVDCDIVHTFRGGATQTKLTRTCFLSNRNDYVAAYIEDQRNVSLWNINTGNKEGSFPANEPVFDMNGVKKNCDTFLLSLTETKLEFYKFPQ